MSKTLKQWQEEIHQLAKDKGWYEKEVTVADRLANIHAEISEAWECYRNGNPLDDHWCDLETGKPEGFPVELADAVIRIFDYAEFVGIDIEEYMEMKHCYNETREHRHGGKLA